MIGRGDCGCLKGHGERAIGRVRKKETLDEWLRKDADGDR
jgi:hypothetical protein